MKEEIPYELLSPDSRLPNATPRNIGLLCRNIIILTGALYRTLPQDKTSQEYRKFVDKDLTPALRESEEMGFDKLPCVKGLVMKVEERYRDSLRQ